MISDVDLVVAMPIAGARTPARPGGLAWALGALIVGSVVAVDPAGLVPTGPMRWTAITVTTGLALAVLVRRAVAIPRVMTGVWVALIGVLLIATIRAVDPLDAWIGTPDRRLGLLAWLTFPALFVAGHACGSRAATRVVLRAGSLGAVVFGVWSAAELLGHSPLGLEFANGRAGGPFGQPAYLGAACLLVGPLCVATALDRNETRGWRCAGAFGFGGAVFALGASQTRGAWVGAVVAAVALALRKRGVLRRHRRRVVLGAVALAAVAVAVGVATPLGARAASTFDLRHGTNVSRFGEWRIATRTIADHPLLGVGPEGYRVVFPQEVDAAYVRDYGDAVYTDRAHNGILDVTLDGGIFAGSLYLALVVLAVRHAWHAVGTHDLVGVALGAAVIAYIVQQQFLFPLSELDPISWVLVGMLVVRTPSSARCPTLRARWLVVPIAIATGVALFYGARDVLADQAMKRAATTADARTALREADDATRLRPDSIRTWFVAARVAQRGAALTDVDAALARVTHGLDRSARDPALRDLYGELLVERAARSRLADDIALARREIGRLVAGAPHDPMLHEDQVIAESLREIGKTVNRAGDSGVYQAMQSRLPVHDPPVALATPTGPDPTPSAPTPTPTAPETIDLTAVHIGPPRDFETFYRDGYADIARALTVTLGDLDLAQEATDEAMVRAYARWNKIGAYDNPGGWVYRVGLNWARSARRRLSRVAPFHERRVVDAPATDPAHFAALRDLDVGLRSVVVCRLLLDWSVDETAAALRIKPGTVKSRLHRALAQLEQDLGDTQ